MRSLYEAEIPIKVYRTWFLLNSRTTISVKTPASLSGGRGAVCPGVGRGSTTAQRTTVKLPSNKNNVYFVWNRKIQKGGEAGISKKPFDVRGLQDDRQQGDGGLRGGHHSQEDRKDKRCYVRGGGDYVRPPHAGHGRHGRGAPFEIIVA